MIPGRLRDSKVVLTKNSGLFIRIDQFEILHPVKIINNLIRFFV